MLREVMRDFLHLLIFLDLGCAAVCVVLAVKTSFFRANEYLDRRGSLFSLRTPLPSQFSKEYCASYRQSLKLAIAFAVIVAIAMFLFWLDTLIFGRAS